MFDHIKLTDKQVESFEFQLHTRKHWTTRRHVVLGQLKAYQLDIKDEELDHFMNVFIPSEVKRVKRARWDKIQKGIIKSPYTPTDVKGTFDIVENPKIGAKYHISWAYSGAQFKLIEIKGDIAYLDNPKYRRNKLLQCKVSELRHLAKH